MKAISGQPIIDKYALTDYDNRYSLDFIYSNKLDEIEEGIRETAKGIDFAMLGISVAFAKIDREALYTQSGCKSYLEYLDTAEDRLNMSRQSMSDYKRMGEVFLQYKSKLQGAGFEPKGHLHKLRYLKKALENHRATEVFKRIGTDSLRQFARYAIGEKPSERLDEPVTQYTPDIRITAKKIMVDGKNILRFDPSLNVRTKEELAEYLRALYEIRATGNIPHVLNLYDENEAKAVENYLKRFRKRK